MDNIIKMVKEFITASGLDTTHNAVGNQHKALLEELNELRTAATNKDEEGILDGIGDCLFIMTSLQILDPEEKLDSEGNEVAAVQTEFDISDDVAQEVLRRVCASNLTKFSDTLTQAAETKEKYEDLGVVTKSTFAGSRIVTRSVMDQTDKNGKEYFKDKILKSVNFQDIDVSDLLPL